MDPTGVTDIIPGSDDWSAIEPLTAGWSTDTKYRITRKDGTRLLLRISDIGLFDRKRIEFERITAFSRLGFPMNAPVGFGRTLDGTCVYLLLTWVDGDAADTTVPKLDETQQYELGRAAGCTQKLTHTVPAPADAEPWEERYTRKTGRMLKLYRTCGHRIRNADAAEQYIRQNMHLLQNRPQVQQQGDHHIGNMLVTPGNGIALIDFNRSGHGDPWEEYDRFHLTWTVSVPFALGQLHGYFNDNVPDAFFRLQFFYNMVCMLGSMPWAVDYGPEEIAFMNTIAERLNKCYRGFTRYIPEWYERA